MDKKTKMASVFHNKIEHNHFIQDVNQPVEPTAVVEPNPVSQTTQESQPAEETQTPQAQVIQAEPPKCDTYGTYGKVENIFKKKIIIYFFNNMFVL